jgi:predicted secreted protein
MKQLFHNLLIISFLIAFCAGCSSLEVNKEYPEVNPVPPNTKFRIILAENHTTGYIWQLKQDYNESVINQVNEVWHGNEKGIYFNLESLSAGQTTLTFVSRKYTDTAEIKRFVVKIEPK